MYEYENGELIGVTFASGKSVTLEYNASGYLTTVVSSEKMQSALSYTNNILSGVKTWSCVEAIEHGAPSETTNTDAMTEMTIGYSENFITVTDDKENTTYYKVDDEDNLYEYYEEQAGKVTKAEKETSRKIYRFGITFSVNGKKVTKYSKNYDGFFISYKNTPVNNVMNILYSPSNDEVMVLQAGK